MRPWLKLLAVFLFLTPTILPAQEQEKGEVYVIRKGDTLWGISERFIKDPTYWPSLWSKNPYIRNPHFIYPGQKVRIYDGRIEFVPEPVVPAEIPPVSEPEIAPSVPLRVQSTAGFEGFVTLDEYQGAGQIVDAVDNRLMVAQGDRVFLSMKNPGEINKGDLYSVFTEGREVRHPLTRELLGYQVEERGTLIIEEVHAEVASGRILDSVREMERGAKLVPAKPVQKEVALKQAQSAMEGLIIAARDNRSALSSNDVIYVDLGADDGLEVGNMLMISRPRTASELGIQATEVRLPDLLLGAAVVVGLKEQTASALIIKQTEPIYRGDRVGTDVQ